MSPEVSLMDAAESETLPAARKARRGPGERLREAITALAQGHARILSHGQTPWASITFSGTRHRIDLVFEGRQAADAAEDFIAGLPDHEFAIPGQLVADATIIAVEQHLLPEPRMIVCTELLLLDDC